MAESLYLVNSCKCLVIQGDKKEDENKEQRPERSDCISPLLFTRRSRSANSLDACFPRFALGRAKPIVTIYTAYFASECAEVARPQRRFPRFALGGAELIVTIYTAYVAYEE